MEFGTFDNVPTWNIQGVAKKKFKGQVKGPIPYLTVL